MEGKQVVAVTPRTARRSFSKEFKRELVRQSMLPEVSRAALALANGVNANQLARWCREHQRANQVTFVPVVSTAPAPTEFVLPPNIPAVPTEIEWRHGNSSLMIRGKVDVEILRTIISQTLASSRAS